MKLGAERKWMEDAGHPEDGWNEASPWYPWGPYLPERAWGSGRRRRTARRRWFGSAVMLAGELAGRTTIVISHRATVAARTDRVVVLGG